ncbi:hypothetical protein FYJ44_08275 [Desulfovibrio sp. PG-178-WT-4]|uniref:HdeA/HdeB family protein n=1 Tax=Desulfovibrio porci TaxID=2605782 RepID=A0A6L5XLJ7_9BACT|nr:hypothetical protein [Desulfovibrio porci]MDY3810633.1 hypothetical protein [Desulfovibrio porci]MSS28036.1 hypothetical protein [Desulfovibrio porci]
MRKLFMLCCLMLSLPVAAQAADEKIDPATYICAELVATGVSGQPPLFEGLQIDGYAAAALDKPVADPNIMAPLLEQVYAACQAKPTEKVIPLWQEARKNQAVADDGPWRADKTTCKQYSENEDDGSGFVIWLDGYNRQKSGKPGSVLESDDTLKAYLDACAKQPEALMIDVMRESAK